METKNSSKIKTAIIFAFIVCSVFLVVSVWIDGLSDRDPANPVHIRPTLVNSSIKGFDLTLTANPDQDGRGHGQGGGEGQNQGGDKDHGTPTPTIGLENYSTQDLSSDLLDE